MAYEKKIIYKSDLADRNLDKLPNLPDYIETLNCSKNE